MAIRKIGVYRNPPEDITDFEGMSELLMAYARDLGGQGMILTEWTNTNEYPKLAMGSYLFHGGSSFLVDTEDYTIGAPADGTYYLKIESDDETLAVSWASSLSGYTWNPIYNGLYHPDESQILPYQIVVDGATIEKWKVTNLAQGGGFIRSNWQGVVQIEGVIRGSHINTGDGNFKIGQNLRKSDSVVFNMLQIFGRKWDENEPYDREIKNAKAGSAVLYETEEDKVTDVYDNSYTKVFEFTVEATGTVTVYFEACSYGVHSSGFRARIYRNGSAVGTDRNPTGTYDFVGYSQNISVNKGDKLQLYARGGATHPTGARNFRIMSLRGFQA